MHTMGMRVLLISAISSWTPPLSWLPAMPSTSSMMSMCLEERPSPVSVWLPSSSATSCLRLFLDLVSEAFSSSTLKPASRATRLAVVVLPTPGAPESRAALNAEPSPPPPPHLGGGLLGPALFLCQFCSHSLSLWQLLLSPCCPMICLVVWGRYRSTHICPSAEGSLAGDALDVEAAAASTSAFSGGETEILGIFISAGLSLASAFLFFDGASCSGLASAANAPSGSVPSPFFVVLPPPERLSMSSKKAVLVQDLHFAFLCLA
uniref:Secreted protein n=1 Tax=Ixodes ricinus TaxID=34613 RepID=A0A6B0V6M7_IXORI